MKNFLFHGLLALFLVGAIPGAHAQEPPVSGPPDFADLVAKTAPAVVNIRTASRVTVSSGPQHPFSLPNMDPNDPFYNFFHRLFPQQPGPQQPGAQQPGDSGSDAAPSPAPAPAPRIQREMPRGVGSGFLISPDGYLITNAHVVDGADEITVTFPDKRVFKGRLIGSDPRSDVALVKIDGGKNLPTLKLGDPSRLRVGEWVIAIGSPFDLQNTVTHGIVSAMNRETGELLPFIQTDAPVNPGNSGGPLINMRGEVVGINSQIFTTSGSYAGISFAIPIDEAQRIANILRTKGKVVRGRIGVLIGEVDPDVAAAIGLSRAEGASVAQVEPDGPAQKAGVRSGDVITRFAGKPVEDSASLRRMVADTAPGTHTTLTVWRNGAAKVLTVVVGLMPQESGATAAVRKAPPLVPKKPDALGLVVRDLTADQRQGGAQSRGGVVVESAAGAAGSAGIQSGDVLLSIANTPIRDARQFRRLVAKLRLSKPIAVLVRRGEQSNWVVLNPSGN